MGNFYGTTQSGGRLGCGNECGTVFKLAPDGTESVLFKFKGPPNDGNNPDGNLIIDQSGNYFGTLFVGGRAGCYAEQGCGAVFKLAPDGTETIPHFFTGKNGDGSNPSAGLISDSAGNLYGTTEFGGGRGCIISSGGCGTVFEIATNGTESVLHSFGKGNNGAIPASGLVADGAGNLYGTASHGGGNGYGTVFEITP
ncbi:MAG TPA: choice-of-anchor tandem repeat GloVer-containing protein [Rhizomicrobium sp.]